MNPTSRQRLYYFGAFALICLAGLALRFYRFAPPGSRADPARPLATLPPGLDTDEAFHALAALRLTRGEIAPFFKIDQGLAAAMIYLTAPVILTTGPVAEAIRIAAAIMGVGLLFGLPFLPRRLWPDHPEAALASAAYAAFVFWFVNFSRFGVEEIVCAALVALAFAALWEWLERGGLYRAMAAGAALALALYSYPAAYIAPVAAGAGGLYALSLTSPRWRPRWREMAAALIAFAFIAAPLVIFFVQSPEWILRRSSQVAGSLNVIGTLLGVAWRGDEIVRFNIPGRPLLDPAQTILFVIGLLYCCRRWRERPFGLLLIWLGVMLMPPALSAAPEHFGRIAGAMGAIALIGGAGAIPLWRYLPRWLAAALLAAAFAYSAARTAYDYFILWPRSPAYLDAFDFPERLQAEAIAALPPDADAYLTPSDRNRPIFAYLWGDPARAQSFNGRVCTVFPRRAERDTVWLVNSLEDKRTPLALREVFPTIRSRLIYAYAGEPAVEQLEVSAGEYAAVSSNPVGRIGDLAEVGVAEIGQPSAGAPMPVRFLWRVIGLTAESWTIGVYLLDANMQVRAQDDRQPCDNSFPTSTWRTGELIAEERSLNLPPDLAPGDYTLAVAFYRLSDGQRLPTLAVDGVQDTLLTVAALTLP